MAPPLRELPLERVLPVRLVVAAAAVVSTAFSPAQAAGAPLRGQTDQNQPVVLTREQARTTGFRVTFLTRCFRRDQGSSFVAVEHYARTVSSRRTLTGQPRGRFAASFRIRRVRTPRESYGLEESRSVTVVRFWGTLRRDRTAAGGFRVRSSTLEVRGDAESEPLPYRRRRACDSGARRWVIPRMSFSRPWRPTAPVIARRDYGAIVPLVDNRLLVAGGCCSSDLARSELYDPRTNRWARAGRLQLARFEGALARLGDGRVVLAGGWARAGPRPEVDIYDPRRNRWKAAAPLRVRRWQPAAAPLPDGRLLVVGGWRGPAFAEEPTATVEAYDPLSDRWSVLAPLPPAEEPGAGGGVGRLPGFAAALPSGRVIVVGDWKGGSSATSTLYDPVSNSWTPREQLPGMVDQSAATQLPDGRVLVVGNCFADLRSRRAAAIYGSQGWSRAAKPPFCQGTLAKLPSGRALFAARRRAAIYDPETDHWSLAPPYLFPHASDEGELMVAPLADGALIVERGLNRFSAAERFYER
jgi:hypothetical protein